MKTKVFLQFKHTVKTQLAAVLRITVDELCVLVRNAFNSACKLIVNCKQP